MSPVVPDRTKDLEEMVKKMQKESGRMKIPLHEVVERMGKNG